jgi:NADH-quinone oxidoreductase subunit G
MPIVEIDGQTFEVENGKMIIEIADNAGIPIPRFCYHKKLSVAANCRMCLVELENGRKTVPACATPITDGMKVFTKSKEAIRSQKAVMDFLLINHPLDCPICDQGGECELQDLSMGYGSDASEYNDIKRAVENDDLGPLISTEMTRCIHCTRCVRFGDEVAGLRELGATGRGEDMQIGTYIKHSITSEVSGNVIDLCPVGALTSKPYRFTARPWEMTQYESIAPHDCLGSNVYLHVRRNQLMRVVPREQESINETWLSDRDRFSYLGMNHPDRAGKPMIKRDGQWEAVDWKTALSFAADGMGRVIKHHGPEQFAAFASASSTLEELYLLQKLMRELGVNNLDHRLQQIDFQDQFGQPTMPTSTLPYAEIERQDSLLLVGCNIDREVPLAGIRVRKAFLNGAEVGAINSMDYAYHFDLAHKNIISPHDIPMALAKLVLALVDTPATLSSELQKIVFGLTPDETIHAMATMLKKPNAVIITGALCENHPDAALLRLLLAEVQARSGARLIRLTTGANAAGAWLAGMVPHRTVAGVDVAEPGLDVNQALEAKLKGYLLMGAEPGFDFAHPFRARQAMLGAEFVVVMSAYANDSIEDYADVILPMAPYSETSGTYINVDRTWQTVKGAVSPFGDARPAWKILRVLGNLFHCKGFEYVSSEAVLDDIRALSNAMVERSYTPVYPGALPVNKHQLARVGEWPLYRVDAIVRHAEALQQCAATDAACMHLHPETADRLKLADTATVSQGDIEIRLPIIRNERMALDVVWLPNALPETADLGHAFSDMIIKC